MRYKGQLHPRGKGKPSLGEQLAFLGLCLFTVVIVTTKSQFAALGLLLAIAGIFTQGKTLLAPRALWWGLFFLLWTFVSLPFAIDVPLALETAIERVKVIGIFFVAINALRTPVAVKRYAVIFCASFMMFPALGAIRNYMAGITTFGRAIWNGVYANPNDLASMAMLCLGMVISLLANREERTILRLVALGSALVLVLLMLLTQSRGAFLGLMVGLGLPLILSALKKPRQLAIVTIPLLVVLFTVVPKESWERIAGISRLSSTSTIAQADPEGSAAARWGIQQTALNISLDNPIVGVGVGNYPLANSLYSPHLGRTDTHNTYLNLTAELGFPGLFLWLGFVISILKTSAHQRADSFGLRGPNFYWLRRSIIGFLVAGIFGSYSGLTIFYLVMGLLFAAATHCQQRAPEPVAPLKPKGLPA
jgi:O-antigen ligase